MENTMKKNPITEGVIWKQMLLFCIPIMVGTLFQQLYNIVDVIVVGRFVSTKALACVGGSSGMMINLFVGFFTGMTSGVTVIVARYFGAADWWHLNEGIHTSVAIAIIGGVLFGVLGVAFAPLLLQFLGTPNELMNGSLLYLRIYFIGILFTFLFNTGSAILRALGDAKQPLYYLMICCFVNIVLDVLLVVVFHLGIAGVAIATVTAQAVSSYMVLHALQHLNVEFRVKWKQIKFHKQLFFEIIRIGLPAGIQSVMNSLSGMIMTSAVNSLETIAVAGNTAYAKLDGIYWMVSNAFSVSIATFVAQNLGAKKFDRVKQSIVSCMILDFVLSSGLSVFFFSTSQFLLHLFTNDSFVIDQALQVMKAIAPYYWIVPIYEVLASSLRGMNDVFVCMIINIIGLCGVRAAWIFFLIKHPSSIYQIIISCPVSWIFTAICTTLYFIYNFPRLMKKLRI